MGLLAFQGGGGRREVGLGAQIGGHQAEGLPKELTVAHQDGAAFDGDREPLVRIQGHGIGKLFAPLARRQASKEVPHDQAKLKERLEGAQT